MAVDLFSNEPLPFWRLVMKIFVAYSRIFKPILILVLLTGLVHLLDIPLQMLYWPVAILGLVVAFLFSIFLYATILWLGHQVLSGHSYTIEKSFGYAYSRFFPLIGGVLILVLINMGLWVVHVGIGYLGHQLYAHSIFLILLVGLIFFFGVLLFFILPSIIIDGLNPITAVKRSVQLVYGRWWYCFGVLFLVIMLMTAVTSTGAIFHATRHHAYLVVFDFVLFVLGYPLFIAMTLMLLNEVKVRRKQEKPDRL